MQAAALVAAPLAYLMTNDFEKVRVEKLDVDGLLAGDHPDRHPAARLDRARRAPSAPGSTVPLKRAAAHLPRRDQVGDDPGRIPASAPAGAYSLLVADGPRSPPSSSARCGSPSCPRTSTSSCAPSTACAATTTSTRGSCAPEEGAIVGGEYLQSLPPSVLSVLGGASEQGAASSPSAPPRSGTSTCPTDYAVTGPALLSLTVER